MRSTNDTRRSSVYKEPRILRSLTQSFPVSCLSRTRVSQSVAKGIRCATPASANLEDAQNRAAIYPRLQLCLFSEKKVHRMPCAKTAEGIARALRARPCRASSSNNGTTKHQEAISPHSVAVGQWDMFRFTILRTDVQVLPGIPRPQLHLRN